MAKQREYVDPKNKKKGFFSPFLKPLGWVFSAASYLVIALAISILVEWVGITFFWPADHASQTLTAELSYLGDNFSTSITGLSPAELAVTIAVETKSFLTENALINGLNSIAYSPQSSTFMRFIAVAIHSVATYAEAALFVTLVVTVRFTVVALASLVIVIVTLVSALDGLVERELRKVGGDIEHSKIAHQAMYWAPKLALVAPIVYLAWPWVANPVYFFVPSMLLYGFTNYLVFSQYQKQL